MNLLGKIDKLKIEKNTSIMAHNYQSAEIQEIADFVGDSLEMARKSREIGENRIVVCGADFMAETVKILNPEKTVLNPTKENCCLMAVQINPKMILDAKKIFPKAKVVLYVNSNAECKALADSCCTSGNADRIVNSMDSEQVIFAPDRNLAWFVQQRTKKKVVPIPADGHCYVHSQISLKDLQRAKAKHPLAEVIAHPECLPEVQRNANAVRSTSGMISYARESKANEFIIATEISMLYRLRKELPHKKFYPASENAVCIQQKKVNLQNLLEAIEKGKHEVKVDEETRKKAESAIENMLKLS